MGMSVEIKKGDVFIGYRGMRNTVIPKVSLFKALKNIVPKRELESYSKDPCAQGCVNTWLVKEGFIEVVSSKHVDFGGVHKNKIEI